MTLIRYLQTDKSAEKRVKFHVQFKMIKNAVKN